MAEEYVWHSLVYNQAIGAQHLTRWSDFLKDISDGAQFKPITAKLDKLCHHTPQFQRPLTNASTRLSCTILIKLRPKNVLFLSQACQVFPQHQHPCCLSPCIQTGMSGLSKLLTVVWLSTTTFAPEFKLLAGLALGHSWFYLKLRALGFYRSRFAKLYTFINWILCPSCRVHQMKCLLF